MCLGVSSPGTIREVLRGYIGDKSATSVFDASEEIEITKYLTFNAKLFNLISKDNYLRPFELASLRLKNMIEVITHWQLYMTNESYLTQRGGTFLIDYDKKVLYHYKSKSLLSYSKTMSEPLSFLNSSLF